MFPTDLNSYQPSVAHTTTPDFSSEFVGPPLVTPTPSFCAPSLQRRSTRSSRRKKARPPFVPTLEPIFEVDEPIEHTFYSEYVGPPMVTTTPIFVPPTPVASDSSVSLVAPVAVGWPWSTSPLMEPMEPGVTKPPFEPDYDSDTESECPEEDIIDLNGNDLSPPNFPLLVEDIGDPPPVLDPCSDFDPPLT